MKKINDNERLRDLAGEFFARLSPGMLKQIDNMFEHLKTDSSTKLEVNFGLAMPPEMRQKVLYSIGLRDTDAPPISDRYIPYLKILKKIIDRIGDNIKNVNQEEIAALICEEGRKARLFDYEIQQLTDVFPSWFASISRKCVVEITPADMCSVSPRCSEVDAAGKIAFQGIIGSSETMQSMFACLKKISTSNLSVLIQGESGTGKELVAHAIHALSERADHGFIPVNCGALPDSIIESELFGYEKGAFTGAMHQKAGYFEFADKGTIFLDEITETSLNTQVKLLRVLQEKQFFRVGGTRPVSVDCRVIAATNRNILDMAKQGTFRHDLYYRINEMTISLPPLRERKDDLPLLVNSFLKKFALQNKRKAPSVSDQAWDLLRAYNWPGNIRELENSIKRAVVFADDVIKPEHFPAIITENAFEAPKAPEKTAVSASFDELVQNAEREILLTHLKKHNFNVSQTADALKISRRTLQRKMSQYLIAKPH